MGFDPGSRSKLTRRDLARFGGDTLFHRVAREVCESECLARKELFPAVPRRKKAERYVRVPSLAPQTAMRLPRTD